MVHDSIEDFKTAKEYDEIAKEAVVDDHFEKSNKIVYYSVTGLI